MSIEDLEFQLELANRNLEIVTTLNPGDEILFRAAYDLVLDLERKVASLKKEEYAIPLDFRLRWSVGAPLPFLLRSDQRTLLTFYIQEEDPAWEGTYITLKHPASGILEALALVEFDRRITAKLGSPNDEVHSGHQLYGKGMKSYSAQEVINSTWLAQIEKTNSVHSCFCPERWSKMHHYVFWFHDSTFECIAESFKVQTFRASMKELLEIACRKLIGVIT